MTLLTWMDITIERPPLRPTRCAQLMAPPANLPLNCLPAAVLLRLTGELDNLTPPTDGLAIADATVSLDRSTRRAPTESCFT